MQTTPVDRPRFRQDLVAEPIEDGGARFIDVMDPDSGTLYRFFEVEYSLACAMDGERDVAGIVKWADEELGLKTNAKEVGLVVSTLGDLGFIEARGAAATAAAARAKTPTPMDIGKVEAPPSGRWDQPTAMGTADEYLQKGVVHGSAKAVTPAPDVELGKPGTRPSQPDALPRAPELELGAPGIAAAAAASSARGVAARADDIPLGKPGKSESVETDLAADMPLSAAAVKEAVRQSQIMKAVDVPPEIAAEVNKPAAAKAEAKAAAKVEAKPVEAKPVEAKPVERPVEKPAQKPAERPVERPAPPVEAPRAETRPPAAAPAVSPMLIAALVLVLLGLGGFALYKFVFKKKDSTQTTGQMQPTQPTPTPEPPAAPPAETAKLATEQPPADEIKPVAAGQVATIVGNDTAVKEGDAIARLVGFKPVEAQVVVAEKALAKARDAMAAAEKERDAAQTAGNKNGVASAEKKIAAAQKTIAEQEPKLATQKAALDKFLIKSPASGKVTAVAKANAKVTPTDVIATLTRDPVLVATFKSAGEVAVGTRVLLAPVAGGSPVSCTVAQSGGDGVKIACPKDVASEGAEVKYAGVDPNAAAPDMPPPGAAPTEPVEPPSDEAKPDEPKVEEPKVEEKKVEEKKAEKRPRPRPRPRPPADKPAGDGDGTGEPGGGTTEPATPAGSGS